MSELLPYYVAGPTRLEETAWAAGLGSDWLRGWLREEVERRRAESGRRWSSRPLAGPQRRSQRPDSRPPAAEPLRIALRLGRLLELVSAANLDRNRPLGS